jgi:predicted ATPase
MKTSLDKATPFVSRDEELSLLTQQYKNSIVSKKLNVIFVQADYGVGKTALVEQFLVRVGNESPAPKTGIARCAIETENNGLMAFAELLINLTGGKNIRKERLWEYIKQVAPAWAELIPGGIAGAAVKTIVQGKSLFMSSAYSQENVYDQYANAISKLCEKQALVLFIDDLQWADASSLGLLFHLTRSLREHPILMICAYRPVEAMETGKNADLFREIRSNIILEGAVEIELTQGIDVQKYLSIRYPGHQFPQPWISRIQNFTEGQPLFVNQLFNLWQENGTIYQEIIDGSQKTVWKVKTTAQTSEETPQSIKQVLDERIRLLEGHLRDLLCLASVEGEDFTVQVISRLRELNESEIFDGLEALEHRYRLVQERETKTPAPAVFDFYRFAHRYFREHIYNSLSKGKRRLLHKKVGECLETIYEDRAPVAGQLAVHFHEAGELVKAVQYSLQAAQLEEVHWTWLECKKWCEWGMNILSNVPATLETQCLQFDLLEQLAFSQYNLGNFSAASTRYQEAIELGLKTDIQPQRIASHYLFLAEIADAQNDLASAQRFLGRSKEILNQDGASYTPLHLKYSVLEGLLLMRMGLNEQSVRTFEAALGQSTLLPETVAIKRTKAFAYKLLSTAFSNLNRYPQVWENLQKAYTSAYEADDRRQLVNILGSFVLDYLIDFDAFEESEQKLSEAIAIAQQVGDHKGLVRARAIRGHVFLNAGRYPEAILELSKAIRLSKQLEITYNFSYIYSRLALAHLGLKDMNKAREYAACAVEYVSDQYLFSGAYASEALADVAAAENRWEEAVSNYRKSIEAFEKIGTHTLAAALQCRYAQALYQHGNHAKAILNLQKAINTYEQLKNPEKVSRVKAILETVNGSKRER